jgi:prepilin-type N-terminal cleavage/methylation domain-containing protein
MRAFTLLEVLAALAIAAGALTYLLVTEAEGARRVSRTRNIRTAAMLAEQKIAEIAAGIEKETNGSFEGTAFSWSATRESFAQAPGCSKVTLTVSGGGQEVALEEVVE